MPTEEELDIFLNHLSREDNKLIIEILLQNVETLDQLMELVTWRRLDKFSDSLKGEAQ